MVKYSAILLYSLTIALLVVLVVASFNPGCTNVDTIDMWGQAHSRVYHDWHPVALTIIMTYLIPVYDGFQPVVILQTLLFTLGVFLTIRRHSTPLVGVALLLGVTLFPPVFYWLGFVGKDAFMACPLIFAIGALYRYSESGSRTFFWLGIAGLYLGFAARHNGIFAVIPLLAWPLLRRPWARSVLMIIVIVVGFLGLSKLTSAIFHVRHEYPEQGGFLYDLAALSVRSGTMLVPPEFQRPGISLAMIQKVLDPFNDGWLFFGADSVFRFTENPANMKDLERTWVRAVVAHPGTFLAWRSEVFSKYAGLDATELEPIIESCIVPNDLGLAPVESRLHLWAMDHLQPTGQSILFRPYLYLSILLIFVVQGIWLKRWDTAWIAFSGLAYSLGYFVFGQSSNFRLAVFSAFVAVLLLARLVAEGVGGKKMNALQGQGLRNAPWYTVISLAMLVALFGIVHLARPRHLVLADKAVFSNGDFESGSLAPWKPFEQVHASVISDHAHGGKYDLAESDGEGSVYQDLTGLEPGRVYVVSAWVSSSPGATAPAQISFYSSSANVATFSKEMHATTDWRLLTHSMVAGQDGILRLHLFRRPGSGTIYWDDLSVELEK